LNPSAACTGRKIGERRDNLWKKLSLIENVAISIDDFNQWDESKIFESLSSTKNDPQGSPTLGEYCPFVFIYIGGDCGVCLYNTKMVYLA
jgi:hypothetical protein